MMAHSRDDGDPRRRHAFGYRPSRSPRRNDGTHARWCRRREMSWVLSRQDQRPDAECGQIGRAEPA